METYSFVPQGDGSLFVGWHAPESGSADRRCAVLVSPIHEEKKASHRPLVDLARRLAWGGIHTFRFDYRGTGDSPGEPATVTLGQMCEGLRAVIAHAIETTGVHTVDLVGLRLGADVAALVAETQEGISSLALCVPVGRGSRYVSQARLRSKIRGQLTPSGGPDAAIEDDGGFDFDGHYLPAALIAELEAHDLAARGGPLPIEVLCLDVCAREKPSVPVATVAESLERRGASVRLRAVADEPFWNALGPVEPTEFIEAVSGYLGV